MTPRLGGPAVDAVLFDYGNTLMTVERPDAALQRSYERIAQRLRDEGLRPPAPATLLRDVHDRVENEFIEHQRSGALEEMDLVAAVRRAYSDLGMDVNEHLLDDVQSVEQEAWWQGIHLEPQAISTLEALRAQGKRVGLCSNAPYRVRSLLDQLAYVGLRQHLDSVTFSAQVGWRKPSARIFAAALRALGASAASTVMVGDSIRDDIAGARAAGLRSVLYTAHQSTTPAPSDAAPDATVDSLSELIPLLQGTRIEADARTP